MSNPSRSPTRTPSIAIPGSVARNLDGILNINSLASGEIPDGSTTLPQSARYRADQPHSPSQSRTAPRSLYGALESNRPTSSAMRHATSSSSLGATRHALGGGSGPLLPSRAASYSVRPGTSLNLGSSNTVTSFEPRIVGGSAVSSDFVGAPGSVPRSTSRSGLQASRPRRLSHKDSHPPANVIAPYGHHILGSGSPQPFKRPSYLQYSFLRERLQTETLRNETLRHHQPSSCETSTVVAKADKYESDLARARPSMLQVTRKPSSQNDFEVSSSWQDDSVSYLPTRWSEDNILKFLHISEDGRNLYFHGPASQGEKDAAAARSDRPIPSSSGIYYFEVTILDKGSKGHISIGFSQSSVKLNRLPGWEENSWGYHGDDGHSFASERDGSAFGPRFSTKDVVGCGIDFSIHKAFYTKNGSFIGYAFDNIAVDNVDLYPSVGLRTQQEAVRVNFGHETFKYDIDYYVLCAREQAWTRIQSTPVRWLISQTSDVFQLEKGGDAATETKAEVKEEVADDGHDPIQLPPDFSEPIIKLIHSYLLHHGYDRTASSLKTQADERNQKAHRPNALKSEPDVDIKMEMDDLIPNTALSGGPSVATSGTPLRPEATQSRRRVTQAITSADIDQAIRLLGEFFPSVLHFDEGLLLLKLKCRKFVELILRTSEANKAVKSETAQALVSKPADSVMDVDDDAPKSPTNGSDMRPEAITPVSSPVSPRMRRSSSRTPATPAQVVYQNALSETLAYGRALHKEVHESSVASKPDVQELLRMTFSLVTYDDPLAAGGAIQAIASEGERERLAIEVNQAILESQGRPSRSALERIYQQTSVVTTELALLGVGDAAFADMQAEFLDT